MSDEWPRSLGVVGFGVLVLGFVWLLASWTLLPIWKSMEHAAHDAELIKNLRELVAEKPAYEREIIQASQILNGHSALYNGPTAELASAELQNTLSELVSGSEGQVQTSAIGIPQPAHGLEVLSVTMDISIPQQRIASFFNYIKAQKPYLVIQSIELRSTDSGSQNGPLDVQLQIDGFSDAK